VQSTSRRRAGGGYGPVSLRRREHGERRDGSRLRALTQPFHGSDLAIRKPRISRNA
jgi:hypothetical protein